MFQSISVQAEQFVIIKLSRNREPVREARGEILLPLNELGNLIIGLEIVGGFVDFSISEATKPFGPVLPDPAKAGKRRGGVVTYDPDADAAMFFLTYAPLLEDYSNQKRAELLTVSHKINPTCIFGLDQSGGLVYIKIPIPDVIGSPDQFLQLLKTD